MSIIVILFLLGNVSWHAWIIETEIQAAAAAPDDHFNNLVELELHQILKQKLLASSQASQREATGFAANQRTANYIRFAAKRLKRKTI